jgi:DNA-binding NarL/FixJ family response regulator
MREILASLLASLPHVELLPPADDGAQAAATLAGDESGTGQPGVMLLDWDLAGEAALSVLRRVKADAPRIRCVMMVNSYQAELLSRSARADAILYKGFSVHELMGVMSNFWNEKPLS